MGENPYPDPDCERKNVHCATGIEQKLFDKKQQMENIPVREV
jgi:hypothetical protein